MRRDLTKRKLSRVIRYFEKQARTSFHPSSEFIGAIENLLGHAFDTAYLAKVANSL